MDKWDTKNERGWDGCEMIRIQQDHYDSDDDE